MTKSFLEELGEEIAKEREVHRKEEFGFDGKKPVPCSDRAVVISVALFELIAASSAYGEAKRNVPEYTGQWDDKDYYANELEALYRAADNYEQALAEK